MTWKTTFLTNIPTQTDFIQESLMGEPKKHHKYNGFKGKRIFRNKICTYTWGREIPAELVSWIAFMSSSFCLFLWWRGGLVYIEEGDGCWPIGARQGEGLMANFCRNLWHGWNGEEDGWDVWRVRLRCGEKGEFFWHVLVGVFTLVLQFSPSLSYFCLSFFSFFFFGLIYIIYKKKKKKKILIKHLY